MNHLLLYMLGSALAPHLTGRKIASIRLLRPLLVITLGGRNASYLAVALSAPGPFCYLCDEDPLEGHGEPALRRIVGRKVAGVEVASTDRVLRLTLGAGAEGEALAIYPRGSATKVRIESEDTVVESLDVRETGRPVGEAGTAPRVLEASAIAALSKGPLWVVSAARPSRALPVSSDEDGAFGPYEDAIAACEAIGAITTRECHKHILARHAAVVRKHIDKRKNLHAQLTGELEEADRFETGRNEANILAAYQATVRQGTKEVELPDLYSAGHTVKIALDPALPIKDQVEKRFKRATKLERSRYALKKRLAIVGREVETLEAAAAAADAGKSFSSSLATLEKVIDQYAVRRRGRAAARASNAGPRYRQFDLDASWFALVGRNDRDNDEITFHLARPNDIWMHAQQIAGSHVIVKSRGADGNPPPRVLEAAAGIAAFYSKAKHSNLVPVIYTMRKYVRKFRGAKPGQVICEREKTIFAEPRLPTRPDDSSVNTR